MSRQNWYILLAFLWFTIFAVVSLLVFQIKLEGLWFHTRDFPFYAGNFARLFSADLSKELAMNPEGVNFLGFESMDGYPNVYFDIHISPIKFALSLLYALTGSLYVLFGVFEAIFLASIAYLIFAYWTVDRRRQAIVLIGAGALVIVPSASGFLTYDLRAFVLILPFLLMLVAALDRRRPDLEVVLIAVFGLMIREEAVISLLLAALYLHLDSRRRVSQILLGLAVAHAALAFAYYGLFTAATYSIRTGLATQAGLLVLVLAYVGLALGSRFGLIRWVQTLFHRLRPLAVTVFVLPFAADFMLSTLSNVASPNIPAMIVNLVTGPRWYPIVALGIISTLTVILAVWPGASRIVRVCIGSVVVVAITMLAVTSARTLAGVYERGAPRQIVLQVAERLRATPGVVVVDYAVYQAFFDRDDVVVWERLPSSLAQDRLRFFPRSRDLLTEVMAKKAAYYVVTEASIGPLFGILRDAGLASEVELCLTAADIIVARRTTLSPPCADLGLPAGATAVPRLRSAVSLAMGQYEAGIRELQQSIAADENATDLAALGRALILAGRPVEAIIPVERAMQLVDVPTTEQLYLLAISNFMQEQYETSAELLETALRSDSRNLRALELLIAVYGQLGRAEVPVTRRALHVARRNFGRFLSFSLEEAQFDPRFRRAEDSFRYLEGLRKAGVPNEAS